jgi:hypothetical protein
MKRIIAVAVLSSALGLSAASADVIDDRAKQLLPWVVEKTGYSADHVKVTVIFAELPVINAIAYGPKYTNQTGVDSVSTGETIFLPSWFRIGTNDDILVHELVHVLQFENDATFKCRAEQEKQAYEVQAAFTEETGIGAKPHPLAMFLLRCSTKSVPH